MMLPDYAADALARHSADLPAVAAIATACALVAAVVVFSGRRRRLRSAPVMGIYQCHSCRADYAVGLVRLPHEHRARLVCTRPDCRVAYAVVPDGDDPADVLRRAREAYMRVMLRGTPPRNTGKRKAAAATPVAETPAPAIAAPAESPDWSRMDAAGDVPHVPGPVPLPPATRTRLVETRTPGGNGA